MSHKTKAIANASASWLRLSPSAVECMKVFNAHQLKEIYVL